MSKLIIIHITDTHYRGTNPKGRIDNFTEAITTKFREVYDMASELKAKNPDAEVIIVHTGDLHDLPDLSDSVAGDLAEMLMDCPVNMYVIPGDHDEFNHNLETVYRTKLGYASRVKILKILDRNPVMFNLGEGHYVQLTGQGRHPYIDHPGYDDYMAPEPEEKASWWENTWIVHGVHGALTPEPFYGTHTLIQECKTNAHVVLTGHLHNGYGLWSRLEDGTTLEHLTESRLNRSYGDLKYRKANTLFCNPGSFARVDATPEDMLRQVKIAILEFTRDQYIATLVPLKSARPGSEVLSREHIIKFTEREQMMNKFLGLLNREGEMKFLSSQEIIHNIAQRKAIPKDVVDDVMVRIAEAREELGRKVA